MNTSNLGCILLKGRKKFAQNFGSGIMQSCNEQTPSLYLVYSSVCYPAGMGNSKIRLLFATLLQHNLCTGNRDINSLNVVTVSLALSYICQRISKEYPLLTNIIKSIIFQ